MEIAGHADRSCFDLEAHAKASNTDMMASIRLDTPIIEERMVVSMDKGKMGLRFKNDMKLIDEHISSMSNQQLNDMNNILNTNNEYVISIGDKSFTIEKNMVKKMEMKKIKVHEKKF